MSQIKKSLVRALTALLAVAMCLAVVPAASASASPAPTAASTAAVPAGSTQITLAKYTALKVKLDNSPQFTRTVTVKDGLRIFRYSQPDGAGISLQFPVKGAVTPMFHVGTCGFLSVCIYLNRTDQEALVNGTAAAIGVAICAIPVVNLVGCAAVAAALAVGTTYLNKHGLCEHDLRLEIGGGARCE